MLVWHCFSRNYVILLVVMLVAKLCSSYNFSQVYAGVYYYPLLKYPYTVGGLKTDSNNYTTTEIRVMLEVIMEKFSKVTTWGTGARNVSYQRNVTYYVDSDHEVRISEVAASINRELGKKSITTLQGIWYFDYNPRMRTEVRLAIESAEKANQIFPGTVEGFDFASMISKNNIKQLKETLQYLNEFKNSSVAHLKVGTTMGYNLLSNYYDNQLGKTEMQIVRDILHLSDFITCCIEVQNTSKKKGAGFAFEIVDYYLLETRGQLRLNYSADELEVIGQLKWDSDGDNEWDNLKNMKAYWILADQWARKHSFPVRFVAAFDTPDYKFLAHKGWWKLTDNSKSDQRSGYVEKISDLNEASDTTTGSTLETTTKTVDILVSNGVASNEIFNSTETTMSHAGLVSISFGTAGLIFLFSLITVLFFRVERLKQKLSTEDIQQFRQGMSDEVAVQHGNHDMDTSALRAAYETLFEIQKDQLKIEHDKILGMGQFGCVFKAIIKTQSEECKHVALKMAKDDCSRWALMSLLTEIKILIVIGKHPNIVALVGAYTAELHKNVVYIATELCAFGSLQAYLRKNKPLTNLPNELQGTEINISMYYNTCESIDVQQMMKWSTEVACGMEYLGTKSVVHTDLAARNVLLTKDKIAKITDFGLSHRMYDFTKITNKEQKQLPWRWMAVESLKVLEFSVKSDVWSYGVLLWEIFTMGDTPYPIIISTSDFLTMLEDGLRLGRPKFATTELYDIMTECWHSEPSERPTFCAIQYMMKKLVFKSSTTKSEIGCPTQLTNRIEDTPS